MASSPKKAPQNTPAVGDLCRLRGRLPEGKLAEVNARGWAKVEWTSAAKGPAIVHLHELERI